MDKQVKALLAEAERQGFTWTATKKGRRYYSPNGVSMVTVHGTPSDIRTYRNLLADFRRAGLNY